MKKMVISGVNFFEGGPLSVFYDCMDTIVEKKIYEKYNITILVHKKELFEKYSNIVKIKEFPKSRKNYLYRCYYEYFFFKKLFKNEHIDIWLSLHDMTPRVKADKIYTYCHNPSPFMDSSLRKIKNIRFSFKTILFAFFYKYIYAINIKKATGIIVQHDWMREKFKELYSIKNVIVARPLIKEDIKLQDKSKEDKTIFIFASYPRYFKNFEQICEACKLIKENNYEVWFTLDGKENNYSKYIYNKYKALNNIKWLGIQNREQIFELYQESNCLIFPSKLETWGLPISEYKLTGKDIILIDLPYSYETLGEYGKVMFFEKDNVKDLAKCMSSVINKNQEYNPQKLKKIDAPFVNNWTELLDLIT